MPTIPKPPVPRPPVPAPVPEPPEVLAKGVAVRFAVDEHQISLTGAVATISHLSNTFNIPQATIKKMIFEIKPARIVGRSTLYDLTDVLCIKDTRSAAKQKRSKASIARNNATMDEPLDFTGEKPPMGSTPAEIKVFYQAKKEEQAYIKSKIDNDEHAEKLIQADDAEKTFINAFKVVVHWLDNLPDILERDGVIASTDVQGLSDAVDRVRDQLADDLADVTNDKVHEL